MVTPTGESDAKLAHDDPKKFHQEKGPKSHKAIDMSDIENLPWRIVFLVYFGYTYLLIAGYVRDFIDKVQVKLGLREDPFYAPPGYAPLFKELEYFWLRRCYQRLRDTFERPICSAAGSYITILDRASDDENATYRFTGTTTECLNLGSYNYLGFSENKGPNIDAVAESIKRYSTASASPRMEAGNCEVVVELEKTVARFVGQPAAMVFGMGFATNSTTIPALVYSKKGTLVISDSLNHNSIVNGVRASNAVVRVFRHNEPAELEKLLRRSIVEGQPRTHRPWKKIIIIVEGIYSMEGEICRLPEIVALKKKYKAYLYVDEAHSIGALGKTGRGVCEQTGVNPRDIDILMGTFTKSFGSVGGYISGSEELVNYLRSGSYGSLYASSMSPPCAQMALSAIKCIMGEDGTNDGVRRIQQLKDNSNFFREGLLKLGFHVFGDVDSPVVPMMLYYSGKIASLSRMLLARGIAVVVVGFPVTPILYSRIRFCLSSGHTREDLEYALKMIDEVGEITLTKYGHANKR